jgi:predicted RNase H-like HicB family nuclease
MEKEKDIRAQVESYMRLSYTMTVKYQDEQGGYYIAGYLELPDLTMTGATREEAIKELLLEAPEWFELNIKSGYKIPLPSQPSKYSGRINFRMPRHLHETVAVLSEREGVSINQYLLSAVAKAAGRDEERISEKKSGYYDANIKTPTTKPGARKKR